MDFFEFLVEVAFALTVFCGVILLVLFTAVLLKVFLPFLLM